MAKWATLENWANRVGLWAAAYSAMTGLFGWLSSQMVILKPYGWPEATIAGFILASFGVLVLSASLSAWRFFRPLSQQIELKSSEQGGTSPLPPITTAQIAHDLRGEIAGVKEMVERALTQATQNRRALEANYERVTQTMTGLNGVISKLTSDFASLRGAYDKEVSNILGNNEEASLRQLAELDSVLIKGFR